MLPYRGDDESEEMESEEGKYLVVDSINPYFVAGAQSCYATGQY